jgi:hypothetical protein
MQIAGRLVSPLPAFDDVARQSLFGKGRLPAPQSPREIKCCRQDNDDQEKMRHSPGGFPKRGRARESIKGDEGRGSRD